LEVGKLLAGAGRLGRALNSVSIARAGVDAMDVDGTEIFIEEDDNAAVDVKRRNPNNKAKNPSSGMGSRVLKMFLPFIGPVGSP